MPRSITDIQLLRDYINGVMERAEHHADSLSEVALALAGAIVWRKDDKDIQVFEREGKMTNVLWAWIRGTRYAFSYNHTAGTIEMRTGSTQGQVLYSFSNRTTNQEVKEAFGKL
jgi:hypothetical protein